MSRPNTSYSSLLPSVTSALSWTFSRLSSTADHHNHSSISEKPTPQPSRRPTPFNAPPLAPLRLTGYAASTSTHLLSRVLGEEIRALLPARLQLYDTWTLCYSLEQHGVSLHTLYNQCAGHKGSFVLVVKDSLGGVFGAFVNEGFRPSGGRYYGNGECFLWKAAWDGGGMRFKAFPYSGVNDYMILCDQGFLSVGGGDGKYGLWLDDTFEKGVTSRCPTFGNEPLSESRGGKFEILDVELWKIGS